MANGTGREERVALSVGEKGSVEEEGRIVVAVRVLMEKGAGTTRGFKRGG